MTDRIPFDNLDRQMLARFDPDVEINGSSEVAVIKGSMRIEIVRVADDKLELTVGFSELDFPILLSAQPDDAAARRQGRILNRRHQSPIERAA
jgi:hypothetical protein